MKALYLLRHAKSSWDDPAMADFDRPLNARGLNAAPFMGELMARNELFPDIIISSPAKRALMTAVLIKESSGSSCRLAYDERIYEASINTLRTVTAEIDDEHSSAMLVGHNPGMEGFIRYLTGGIEPMPTAALAVIELSIDSWSGVNEGTGSLKVIYRPKDELALSGRSS